MPQLDVSSYLPQIFWVITTFIVFWFMMDKLIVPRIATTVEMRKRKYDELILKAEDFNKKAINALQRYEETLAAAKIKAAEQIKGSEAELNLFISQKEQEIKLQLDKKIAENEKRLATEKEETLKQINVLSEKAAEEIIKKLGLETSITMDDVKAANVQKDK